MPTKALQTVQTQLVHLGITKPVLTRSWPYVAIITAHFIWGVSFIVAKLTLQEIPPMSLAFLRFVLTILLLLPFLVTEKERVKIKRTDLPILALTGILMVTLNIAFFYAGLAKTTVTSAAVLTLTIPMFSILLGWWVLKEKIYVANLLGICLGFIGALVVIGVPLTLLGLQSSSQGLVGNLLIILASISWVSGAVISKKVLKSYSTLTVTFAIFLVGLITFFIPALYEYLQNPNWYHQVTYLGISGVLFMAIATSISAYFLFEWSLPKLGIIKADLFQYLEPVIASSLGILILRDELRFSFIIGAILITLGAYWATFAKPEHKHHKAHRH